MMSLIIQGIVQGLTEFFPVSSSGHLLFLQVLTKMKGIDNLFLDTFLHSATFLVIIIFYLKDIIKIIKNIVIHPFDFNNKDTKLGWIIIIGSIPTMIIGLIIEKYFKSVFYTYNILFVTWPITALFLIYSDKLKNLKKGISDITIKDSLIIGLVQGVAIFPGISRSGSTIVTALLLKTKRAAAAKFSFLLGLPAMFGAIILEIKNIHTVSLNWNYLIVFLVTVAAGFVGLYLLIKLLKGAKFRYFGIYLIGLIVLLVIMSL